MTKPDRRKELRRNDDVFVVAQFGQFTLLPSVFRVKFAELESFLLDMARSCHRLGICQVSTSVRVYTIAKGKVLPFDVEGMEMFLCRNLEKWAKNLAGAEEEKWKAVISMFYDLIRYRLAVQTIDVPDREVDVSEMLERAKRTIR